MSEVRRLTVIPLIMLCAILSVGPRAIAEPPATAVVRELYVPFEQLDSLLGQQTERVFMNRAEYELRLREAKIASTAALPYGVSLIQADYEVTVVEGRALMRGNLVVDALNDSLQTLSLPFDAMGIRQVTIDGEPAKLTKDDKGNALLLVEKRGQHQVTIDAVMPVTADSVQQTLDFRCPLAPASRLSLTATGNVEIKSGASLVNRRVDVENNLTHMQVIPTSEHMTIVMSLNNRQLRDQNAVLSRGVVVAEITAAYERLHATVSMNVLNGATDEMRFWMDESLEVTSVAAETLSRWRVQTDGGRKQLVVNLRSPATEAVVLSMQFDRESPELENWQFPLLRPLDVVGYSAVLGLLIEDRLRVSKIETASLFGLDTSVLTGAIPWLCLKRGLTLSGETGNAWQIASPPKGQTPFQKEPSSLFAVDPGAPRVSAVAAFYAPSTEHALAATIQLPKRQLGVQASTVVSISDAGLSVDGAFSLTPENEPLMSFDFLVPETWKLEWMKDSSDVPIIFDRHASESGTRIRVRLSNAIEPTTTTSIRFRASQLPAEWFEPWQTQSVEIPAFSVLESEQHSGVIAIVAKDDFLISPSDQSGLIVISDSEKAKHRLAGINSTLAYRYRSNAWRFTIDIARIEPRITARVLSFFRVQTKAVNIHSEIIYFVDRSRTKRLTFSLPESTPTELAISGLDGAQVKETSSVVQQGRRVWTVDLAELVSGSVRLSIDFVQSLDSPESQAVTLPAVRAEQVEYQTGALAIEGHAELRTTVAKSPLNVDIGELADADYQVGKRLLGAFGYVGTDDETVIDISRHRVYPLPSTIVQRAELVSLLSESNRSQTAIRFELVSKANYLELKLPERAELWSVMLDGKPALPQQENNRVLIAMTTNTSALPAASFVRDLRVVYESPAERVWFRSTIAIDSVELFQRRQLDQQSTPIPIADLTWDIILPSGYRLVSADGNLASGDPLDNYLAPLMHSLRWLGGGTRQRDLGSILSSVSRPYPRTDGMVFSIDSAITEHAQPEPGASADEPQRQSKQDGIPIDNLRPQQKMLEQPAGRSEMTMQAESEPPPAPMQAGVTAGPADADKAMQAGERVTKRRTQWAVEGVRSLGIEFSAEHAGDQVSLIGLGTQTTAKITLLDVRRTAWLAAVIGILVFLFGLTKHSWRTRFRYLLMIAVVAVIVPPVTGWSIEFQAIQFAMLAATLTLLFYYVLSGLCRAVAMRLSRRGSKTKPSPDTTQRMVTSSLVLLISLQAAAAADAQQAEPRSDAEVIQNEAQLRKLLPTFEFPSLREPLTVPIPDDAIVIPYTVSDDLPVTIENLQAADRVLVPYNNYIKLLQTADRNAQALREPPVVKYAWSDAKYTATLQGSDALTMEGRLRLEQYSDTNLAVPLALSGAVLEQALVDGQPAKLQLLEPDNADPTTQQKQQAAIAPTNLYLLHTSGQGSKEIILKLQWELDKAGGWFVADGQIPSAPACALTVTVAGANSEVRIGGIADRGNYTTTQPNEIIETALSPDGKLSLRWRDKIAEATVDQGMTVESAAVFDISEDALRLAWHAEFQFRRGRRDSFFLSLPNDYLIEKVIGENVRGWTTEAMPEKQRLQVELLKEAAEQETLTVLLSKTVSYLDRGRSKISVPNIIVDEAMQHQGQLTLRRSSLLQLRADTFSQLSRIDIPDESQWFAPLQQSSPLPLIEFQAYRFAQPELDLQITADLVPQSFSVETQSLLKRSPMETSLETRLIITAVDRPVYQLEVLLPPNLVLKTPLLEGDFQWAIQQPQKQPDSNTANTTPQQRLQINLADGKIGTFSIVLHGELTTTGADSVESPVDDSSSDDASSSEPIAPLTLPQVQVIGAEKQTGAIVIQADPAYDVQVMELEGCTTSLVGTVATWLAAEQRRLARVVIQCPTPDYRGQVTLVRRPADVNSIVITNVKVTDRGIEETILIEASIESSGIREFAFQVPARLANARIEAPLVRQKTVMPVDDGEQSNVRVQLQLQEAIMGQFAVLLSHDHLFGQARQEVPIVTIETGQTTMRLVTLENASRDELIAETLVALEPLDRFELETQARLGRLGGKASRVFRVLEDQAASNPPMLTYATKVRERIETAGARIGLAETVLVVDELGAYRATQQYRVQNRTEPFLELTLPAEARLWTAEVAGEPVKPIVAANGTSLYLKRGLTLSGKTKNTRENDLPPKGQTPFQTEPSQVRIPLIKTAEGDLDYPVVLKYAGNVQRPGHWESGHWGQVEFPLIKTANINVELSQVRLRLPDRFHWLRFEGTLGQVESESELQAGWLEYRTKQITELTELLSSSGGVFSKVRASNNLKQLEAEVTQRQNRFDDRSQAGEQSTLRKQQAANSFALQQAQQQLAEFDSQNSQAVEVQSNRGLLNDRYQAQNSDRSQNVVNDLDLNFSAVDSVKDRSVIESKQPMFDHDWFRSNQLSNELDSSQPQSRLSMPSSESGVKEKEESSRKGATANVPQPAVPQTAFPQPSTKSQSDNAETQQQILGDYQQQAERYGRLLQRRLSEQAPTDGAVSRSSQLDEGAVGGGVGGGYAGDFALGTAIGNAIGNEAMPQSAAMPSESLRQSYLTSLDVELPVRGREYLFVTPGGDVQLSAQSVSVDFVSQMQFVALALLVGAALYAFGNAVAARIGKPRRRAALAILLVFVGAVSLVVGVLPIYGVLSLAIGLAITVSGKKAIRG